MPAVLAFHSVHEGKRPAGARVYHNHSACSRGRDIPHEERRLGTNGYRRCAECDRLNHSRNTLGEVRRKSVARLGARSR